MAATLVLHNNAKTLVVNALKEDLTHVFLGKNTNVNLDATLTTENIQTLSSDNSFRIKQPRINAITTEYRTDNSVNQNDESRITNFFIVETISVNKLVLMNSANVVRGIITFPIITPTEIKSLYVPQIKINVL